MCLWKHVIPHAHKHIYTRVYAFICTYTRIYTHTHILIHKHQCMCTHLSISTLHMCVWLNGHMHINTYVCTYTHYMHKHMQTGYTEQVFGSPYLVDFSALLLRLCLSGYLWLHPCISIGKDSAWDLTTMCCSLCPFPPLKFSTYHHSPVKMSAGHRMFQDTGGGLGLPVFDCL